MHWILKKFIRRRRRRPPIPPTLGHGAASLQLALKNVDRDPYSLPTSLFINEIENHLFQLYFKFHACNFLLQALISNCRNMEALNVFTETDD